MTILIKTIEEKFSKAIQHAFAQLKLEEIQVEVTRSTHPRFGHYQCNSAMKMTKLLKMPPKNIAEKIVEKLEQDNADNSITKLEVAGPGFINLTLSHEYLSHWCKQIATDPKCGVTAHGLQKIVIDFSSPNTAKEMHVGHLRSTIIGDSLARIFEFQGNKVLRLNHIGDFGTSFGMLIAYIKQYQPQLISGEKKADLTLLVELYKASKQKFDSDPEFKKQSQLEVISFQQEKDFDSVKLWKNICEISRKAYQEIYDLLDIRLIERGESFYKPYIEDTILALEKAKMVEISDGAKCIFLEGFANREGEPLPLMLQKSDGAYNYATTDMASIRHRVQDEKADRLIYVTDAGQAIHFAMIFAAAQKAGFIDLKKVRADHVPFGLVLGPDGKKFKTRSGETERLMDLLTAAIDKATSILVERAKEKGEANDELVKETAHVLGINAIKYSDLSCNRTHDYAFSYDRMLRFEGNTAAFLMYSFVRIHGIKRKVQDAKSAEIQLVHDAEINLGLHLTQFAEIIDSIADDLMPNRLCDYLYELAEKFNAFFRDCQVVGNEFQNQRLALCELSAKILQNGLHLLGLRTVTRM